MSSESIFTMKDFTLRATMNNEDLGSVKDVTSKKIGATNRRIMWTVASQRNLINNFKAKPELWNVKHENYDDIERKLEIKKEIAKILRKNLSDVETKWLYLTKRLVLERRITNSKWTYLKELSFLSNSNIVS